MSKIKKLREKLEMSQTELADKSKIKIDTIRKWEYDLIDIKNANVSKVQAVANVFGITIEELITDE